MIEQTSTSATAAGPMLKRVWDAIMGVTGKPIAPITKLPELGTTR